MKNSKKLIKFGSLIAALSPIVAVISCGPGEKYSYNRDKVITVLGDSNYDQSNFNVPDSYTNLQGKDESFLPKSYDSSAHTFTGITANETSDVVNLYLVGGPMFNVKELADTYFVATGVNEEYNPAATQHSEAIDRYEQLSRTNIRKMRNDTNFRYVNEGNLGLLDVYNEANFEVTRTLTPDGSGWDKKIITSTNDNLDPADTDSAETTLIKSIRTNYITALEYLHEHSDEVWEKTADYILNTVKFYHEQGKKVNVLGSSYGATALEKALEIRPEIMIDADDVIIDSNVIDYTISGTRQFGSISQFENNMETIFNTGHDIENKEYDYADLYEKVRQTLHINLMGRGTKNFNFKSVYEGYSDQYKELFSKKVSFLFNGQDKNVGSISSASGNWAESGVFKVYKFLFDGKHGSTFGTQEMADLLDI